jgi:hypothetical protein
VPMTDRIGEFLVRIRAMTAYHVEEVLRAQKAGDSRRFGEIAIERGYINDDAIRRYVDYLERPESSQEGKSATKKRAQE